jgi:hypothetical protein
MKLKAQLKKLRVILVKILKENNLSFLGCIFVARSRAHKYVKNVKKNRKISKNRKRSKKYLPKDVGSSPSSEFE